MGKQNKWQGKPVRQMSTRQVPSNAKINSTAIKPRLYKQRWTNPHEQWRQVSCKQSRRIRSETVDKTTTKNTMDESIKLRTNPLCKLCRTNPGRPKPQNKI